MTVPSSALALIILSLFESGIATTLEAGMWHWGCGVKEGLSHFLNALVIALKNQSLVKEKLGQRPIHSMHVAIATSSL